MHILRRPKGNYKSYANKNKRNEGKKVNECILNVVQISFKYLFLRSPSQKCRIALLSAFCCCPVK